MKVTLHDLKMEKADVQRTIREKNRRLKELKAGLQGMVATFKQSREHKLFHIESFAEGFSYAEEQTTVMYLDHHLNFGSMPLPGFITKFHLTGESRTAGVGNDVPEAEADFLEAEADKTEGVEGGEDDDVDDDDSRNEDDSGDGEGGDSNDGSD